MSQLIFILFLFCFSTHVFFSLRSALRSKRVDRSLVILAVCRHWVSVVLSFWFLPSPLFSIISVNSFTVVVKRVSVDQDSVSYWYPVGAELARADVRLWVSDPATKAQCRDATSRARCKALSHSDQGFWERTDLDEYSTNGSAAKNNAARDR